MPGCAAVGCSNSSEKGFLMKRYPKDPIRRKDWALRTKRENWFPTDSSVLCEVHFEPQMWEVTREDGTRRLRTNAVPTIFFPTKNKSQQTFIKKQTLEDVHKIFVNSAGPSTPVENTLSDPTKTVIDNAIPVILCEDIKCELPIKVEQIIEDYEFEPDCGKTVEDDKTALGIDHSYAKLPSESFETGVPLSSFAPVKVETLKLESDISLSEDSRSILQTLERKDKLLKKKQFLLRRYKNKLKYANAKIRDLTKKLKDREESTENEEAEIFHKLFQRDQIKALQKRSRNISTKFMEWSDETILKALLLRTQCGSAGYEELLKQNLPFPSIRTLQRRQQDLKFNSGVCAEVLRVLNLKTDSLNESEKTES